MKSLFFTLVVLFFSLSLSAQIEVYGRYTKGGSIEPDINFYGSKKISQSWKVTYFALVESTWSEALIGLTYVPNDWLEIGLSSGVEHNPAICRFASNLWIGKNNTSLTVLLEKGSGSDNYWYKTDVSEKLSEKFTVGLMAWRFHGVGPMVKFTPAKSLTYWIYPTYDFEYKAQRLSIGVDIPIQ